MKNAFGRLAEMIPVCRVDDVFVPQGGIRALDLRHDVLRLDGPQRIVNGHRRRHAERHGRELARAGRFLQRLEVLAGQLEQLLRLTERNPAFDGRAAHVFVRRHEIKLLFCLSLDDAEWITGRTSLVDDQHACGALHRADLVLVRPASVVRHRAAAEDVVARRIVHEHDERLAFHVDALVVVPVVFRRDDAVADEDQF